MYSTTCLPEGPPPHDQANNCDTALQYINWQLRGRAMLYLNKMYVFFFLLQIAFFWEVFIHLHGFTFLCYKNKNIFFFTLSYKNTQLKNWKKKSNFFIGLSQNVFCYIFLLIKSQ